MLHKMGLTLRLLASKYSVQLVTDLKCGLCVEEKRVINKVLESVSMVSSSAPLPSGKDKL